MQASNFEFRYRFFIIGACYWVPFVLYQLDKVNAGVALGQWIGGHVPIPSETAIRLVFAAGALLCVLAAAVRTWASAYLQSSVVHDMKLHTEHLVADGPYRFARNPLYLGNMLLALGMGVMACRLGFVVMVFGNLFVLYRLIGREEALLLASHGESFQRYLQAVPRLVPSLSPKVPASGARPRWSQAFLGESFFWTFAVANVIFAVTTTLRYWYITMAISMPVYALTVVLLKRNKDEETRA